MKSGHMEEPVVILPEDSTIVIHPEDFKPSTDIVERETIVIKPEDVGGSSSQIENAIVIRLEDLPGVPYHGEVPAELIRITLPPDELYALERRMLDLINADRAAHSEESDGARPLQWDDAVADVARAHSEDMIARHYMDHVNREGLTPQDRLRQASIWFLASGENIAGTPTMRARLGNHGEERIYTGYPTIELAEDGLMNSPSHRKNILNMVFTHVGVGIARNADGTLVITQNFIMRFPTVGQLVGWVRRGEEEHL